MKNLIAIVTVSLLLLQCSIDRTVPSLSTAEKRTLKNFQNLPDANLVKITSDNEPGEKLWLCLTLISKENRKALINQNIHLYHTDTNGDYMPSNLNDESTARLNGSAKTDSQGRIFVQTILPGDYGSSADNRHIHTTIANAHPEAYDIHFKQFTGYMGNNFIEGSDQHFLADLRQTEDGTRVAFVTIEVKNALMSNE